VKAAVALAGSVVAVAVLVSLARALDVVAVQGDSMAPSLRPGDRLVVARLTRLPRPREIVVARDPRDPDRELVKRVASVSGGAVTLIGDNPSRSTDARAFGAVPVADVRWRVLFRLAAPSRTPPGALRRSPRTIGGR
jgi:signal peptidase I